MTIPHQDEADLQNIAKELKRQYPEYADYHKALGMRNDIHAYDRLTLKRLYYEV